MVNVEALQILGTNMLNNFFLDKWTEISNRSKKVICEFLGCFFP